MTTHHYTLKTAEDSVILTTSWSKAQEWCNFVLFKPTWLPEGLIETSNKIRTESKDARSSHRAEFQDATRSLSIKQFLYDWAPPAYDHPCLWRNAAISSPENTPLPRAELIINNYLWFGLDYRRKPSATINMLRTQIEITTLQGSFDDLEITQIVKGMVPVDSQAKDFILMTSFSELMFDYRHPSATVNVPTSYFKHTRNETFKCYPYVIDSLPINTDTFPGHWLLHSPIENYRLNSLFVFGQDAQDIQEVEYYFESIIEPGIYLWFLATHNNSKNAIHYPPQLDDQECHYSVHTLENGTALYHAWSKTNEHGSHSLVFKIKDEVINCIIKPAPWTTISWATEICSKLLAYQQEHD